MNEAHCRAAGERSPADLPEVWDFVDRFLQQLSQAGDVSRQLRATLDVVRDSIRAELVLLCSGAPAQVTEWSGPAVVNHLACGEVCRCLIASAPGGEGQFVRRQVPAVAGLGFVPSGAALVRLSRSRGAWIVALRKQGAAPFTSSELKLIGLARRLLLQQQQSQQTHDQLKEMLFSLVRCLTSALDARDPYTWGHSERVARISVRLGEQIGLHESIRSELYLGGLLHDIGKIGVPDHVLRKPGRLSEAEFDLVKQHPVIGDAILGHVNQLAHLRPLVRNHHEQFDGSGYPDGLAGEAIPLGARIVAVADSFDAMMSERPYRKAMAPAQVERALRDGSGRQWDPEVVEAFLGCKEEVFPICQRGLGDSVIRAVEDALRAAEIQGSGGHVPLALRPSEHG